LRVKFNSIIFALNKNKLIMARIYNQRKTRSFAMEKVDMDRIERAAKKMQVSPAWLINQAVSLAMDNPSALFDNLKRKFNNGL
jgi:hypothetical protein